MSDIQKSFIIKTVLKNEFVISISLAADQSTAFVGVLNRTLAQNQMVNIDNFWTGSLSIYNIDLNNFEPRSFTPINQLKSCRVNNFARKMNYTPDIKMTSGSEYAYWACDEDFGYVEMASGKVSRFLSQESIGAIMLAHHDKILLKVDSYQTNLYAFYQNIERNDSFVWKPNSLARLKFNSSSQILLTSKSQKKVFIISESTLQVYDTSKNNFLLISTIKLDMKPKISVPSNDGKRLYMKIDEKTIQILDISNPTNLSSIEFPAEFDDYFIVSPDDQTIFASVKYDDQRTIFFATNISDVSNPDIDYLKVENKAIAVRNFTKLLMTKDSKALVIFHGSGFRFSQFQVTNLKKAIVKDSLQYSDYRKTADYLVLSPVSDLAYIITTRKDFSQKQIQFYDPSPQQSAPDLPIPSLSGNLPPEISSDGKFLYISTPEYLMEINITNHRSPNFSRLMKLNIKQFSLEDGNLMYAVIGDYLEMIDLKSKYSLASFQENFLLGTQNLIDLQLLSRNSQNKYSPIHAKHKFLTANFYESLISAVEKEPIISYSVLPSWINFDKDRGRVSIEPKSASLLGSHQIFTTGSFQLPERISSLSFLSSSEDYNNLIIDLTERGYLDEDRFLTTKFNAYKKLILSSQYSPFESEIGYFLRNYLTDQEFAFEVSSSLFINQDPGRIRIETKSLLQLTVQIVLFTDQDYLQGAHETAQILKRTFSASRSALNENQTQLTLEGSLPNINKALQEIVIDLKDNMTSIGAFVTVSDSLNPPGDIRSENILQHFHTNTKPIANSEFPIQTQVNKFSLVSGQSFSININPNTFHDINGVPLKYTLDTELGWLDLSGFVLTGTPPRKLWPFQVDVTLNIANEFKSEKVTFSLNIGMSAVIALQYAILYFGYIFSALKIYTHFHKIYNIFAQRFYRYAKAYQISVDQEVTDATIAPIGFFRKEFENADLLMNYLKKHLSKDFVNELKDEQGQGLDKNKLNTAINQVLESLTFEERHSVKYYIQIKDEQKDIIHQILLDKIILSEINLPSEKQTLAIFNKIKNQWIDVVELEDLSKPYFSVNRTKLKLAIQNVNSKKSNIRSSEDSTSTQRNSLLNISDNNVRSRYLSASHIFEKPSQNLEASLLESHKELENVNIDLLEWALKAHAFKSHHLNAQKDQVTVISHQRHVGSSCSFKIKALLRLHLRRLQVFSKEELGYGLKYMFQKNVLHFCGTPEASMEYETLVVQFLNMRGMILREIYIFGAENKNRKIDHIVQVQEQL